MRSTPTLGRKRNNDLAASASFPVLPSLSLPLKGAGFGQPLAGTATMQSPAAQTTILRHGAATRPQTVSHYDQLQQVRAAMRDKLRRETAELNEKLAAALARAESAEAQLKEALAARSRSAAKRSPRPVPPPPAAAPSSEVVPAAAATMAKDGPAVAALKVEQLSREVTALRRALQAERGRRGEADAAREAERARVGALCSAMREELRRHRADLSTLKQQARRALATSRPGPRSALVLASSLPRHGT